MIAHKRKTASVTARGSAAIQEAVRVLHQNRLINTSVRRWVCESCGMVHTGSAIRACDSCGKTTALVQQADHHLEMRSLW